MAQVMVNFRMDEEIKKNMEQACREMGLSMTTAFTIFATKVGREKRIPFEVAAEPRAPGGLRRPRIADAGRDSAAEPFARKLERLDGLCGAIRRTLTAIHTAIPAAITGLSMERIRLLCGDELKDKAAAVSRAAGALRAGGLGEKDPALLEEYLDKLAAIAAELRNVERTLIPAMKASSGGDGGGFEPYAQRLAAASGDFDALAPAMERFLSSTARGSAQALQTRIRQAAAGVGTAYVLTALENLEGLILRSYDSLPERERARLEADYLPTLELTLRELALAERDGGDTGGKAALCLRAVNVLFQVVSDGRQARQAWDQRSLEAEVAALERLAALRGDISGEIQPEG